MERLMRVENVDGTVTWKPAKPSKWPSPALGPGFAEEARRMTESKINEAAGDAVNHPSHYTFGSIEVIDAIEDWRLDFHRANAVKYIARADHKGNPVQDVRKAVWYLQRWLKANGVEE